MRIFIILFMFLFSYSVCGIKSDERGNDSKIDVAISNSDPKNCSFDFRNFTYPSPYDANKSIKLIDGAAQPTRNSNGLIDGMGFSLVSTEYGSLKLDGRDVKAVGVVISVTTGGSALPLLLFVYEVNGTKLNFLKSVEFGDRAHGGLRRVLFLDGDLVSEIYDPQNAKGDCCPITYSKIIFSWKKGRLTEQVENQKNPNDSANAQFISNYSLCL